MDDGKHWPHSSRNTSDDGNTRHQHGGVVNNSTTEDVMQPPPPLPQPPSAPRPVPTPLTGPSTSQLGAGSTPKTHTSAVASTSRSRQQCPFCPGTYANKSSLNRHIKRYHTATTGTPHGRPHNVPLKTGKRQPHTTENSELNIAISHPDSIRIVQHPAEPNSSDLGSYFILQQTKHRFNRKLQTFNADYDVTFSSLSEVVERAEEIFDMIIGLVIDQTVASAIKHNKDVPFPSSSSQAIDKGALRVRFALFSPALDYPISVPFGEAHKLTGRSLLHQIQHVLNSNQSFEIGDGIKINFMALVMPMMGSPHTNAVGSVKRRKIVNYADWKHAKKAIISIKVKSNKCLIAALAVGRSLHHTHNIAPKKPKLHYSKSLTQERLCIELEREIRCANISLSSESPSAMAPKVTGEDHKLLVIEDLEKIGKHLSPMCISLFDGNFCGDSITVINKASKEGYIDLLYDAETKHVDVITKMSALLGTDFFCRACQKGYRSSFHKCPVSCCVLCRAPGCKNETLYSNNGPYQCQTCTWSLKTALCLDHHVGSNQCQQIFRCVDCNTAMRKAYRFRHQCGYTRCRTCGVSYENVRHGTAKVSTRDSFDSSETACLPVKRRRVSAAPSAGHSLHSHHQCFVQKPSCTPIGSRKRSFPGSVFQAQPQQQYPNYPETSHQYQTEQLDITTAQEQDARSAQLPDSQKFAFDIETDQTTSPSGEHQPVLLVMLSLESQASPRMFEGYDCVDQFCRHIFLHPDNMHKQQWFYAHFGSGFDFLPVLQWLHSYGKILPEVVVRGSRVITMKAANKKFFDSYLFIPIPLASFPKTFGFEDESTKGFFPHLMTSKKTRGFVGKPGYFPPIEQFAPDRMGSKRRNELQTWHSQQIKIYATEHLRYDFNQELRTYCLADAHVLKLGIISFRSYIYSLTSVDPFSVAVTAASACNYIYRARFMPTNSIGILPSGGRYLSHDKQSQCALAWLRWIESTRGRGQMFRSGSSTGGEKKFGNYKVDGCYISADSQHVEVFEFFGCFYHGCNKCYEKILWNPLLKKTMGELYGEVLQRIRWFAQQDIKVECIWECEFRRLLSTEQELVNIYTSQQSPLHPRDAFFGGRTENFKNFWRGAPTTGSSVVSRERLEYVDVCSLYPYVNASCVYPSGHPDEIITSGFPANLNQIATTYFGLVKCSMLPPRRLMVPVLPLKLGGKLLFTLCVKCASANTAADTTVMEDASCLDDRHTTSGQEEEGEENQQGWEVDGEEKGDEEEEQDEVCVSESLLSKSAQPVCPHTDSERVFWGTFCTPELKLAVQKGYQITAVSEIWHWSESKQSVTLFKDYIKSFLKTKTEASGWPDESTMGTAALLEAEQSGNTDSKAEVLRKRSEYINEYEAREGIRLDASSIKRNEGLRFISKLLLNSFWGYLGMRSNLSKTKYVRSYAEIIRHAKCDTTTLTDICIVGDELALVQYEDNEEWIRPSPKTNVILAAFTTAHARCVLYGYMDKLNPNQLCYCDTDSIMYYVNNDMLQTGYHRQIETGRFLGDMTNELPSNVHVNEFYCAGPKFYLLNGAYTDETDDHGNRKVFSMYKVKGITLNSGSSESVNPDSIKQLVLRETAEIRTPFEFISRQRKNIAAAAPLKTVKCLKTSRSTSNKRLYNCQTGESIPYGFSMQGGGGGCM